MRLTILAVLPMAVLAATSARADYAEGVRAWARGDYARAAAAFLPDAQAGNAEAQYMLGRLYALGNGVPQDFAQAWRWHDLAARQGHEAAAQARDSLAAILPPPRLAAPPRAAAPAGAASAPATARAPSAGAPAPHRSVLVLVPRQGEVITLPDASGQQQAAR